MKSVHEQIANNDAFCVMPWVHLHIATNGNVNACCLASEPFGNINSGSLKEIWNSPQVNEFRQKLLSNTKDKRCSRCYATEKNGGLSLRQSSNDNYLPYFFTIAPSDLVSAAKEPIYLDIRFSNVCNFRCRTCYHGASSRWFEEAVKLEEEVSPKPIIRAIENLDHFFGEIADSIDHVEEIYFAGGEPLVMEEHFRILDMLQDKGAYDTYLRYNTNFSKFEYRGVNVFNIWSKFKRVTINASLDAWGRRGEFLRKEQKWEEVLLNREQMRRVCPNVHFNVAVTVSAFNIFHLPDFHRLLVTNNVISFTNFYIDNILQVPEYYSIHILPLHFKFQIREKFEKHIEWIETTQTGNESRTTVVEQFKKCIAVLFAADLSYLTTLFTSRCRKIDDFRNEKTLDIFPELKCVFDH